MSYFTIALSKEIYTSGSSIDSDTCVCCADSGRAAIRQLPREMKPFVSHVVAHESFRECYKNPENVLKPL